MRTKNCLLQASIHQSNTLAEDARASCPHHLDQGSRACAFDPFDIQGCLMGIWYLTWMLLKVDCKPLKKDVWLTTDCTLSLTCVTKVVELRSASATDCVEVKRFNAACSRPAQTLVMHCSSRPPYIMQIALGAS